MLFSLNKFLLSMTHVIDAIEKDVFNTNLNHSQRVTYISLLIGKKLNLSNEELFDLASYALLHDIGISSQEILTSEKYGKIDELEKKKEHCHFGELIINFFPINNPQENIIKYHHEFYNGTGYYGIKGNDIPSFARIICLADGIDILFDLKKAANNKHIQNQIKLHVTENINSLYFEKEALTLLSIMDEKFFATFNTDNFEEHLSLIIPDKLIDINNQELNKMIAIYSKIIDSKSEYTYVHTNELINKVNTLINHYPLSAEEKEIFYLACYLHDIGKIGISNTILEKPDKLTDEEFQEIKKHPTIGYHILKNINGFEEISELVYSHHEKLNGLGYPRGLKAEEINFKMRLLTCLDIYQSLTENRPYRKGFSHQEAMKIMQDMVNKNEIDHQIVNDINIYLA